MSTRAPLPTAGSFQTADGAVTDGSESIFPLCTQDPTGGWQFLATAFFICTNGIFATARHVVMDRSGKRPQEPLVAFQFLPDNSFIIRPVQMLSARGDADVAIGILAPVRDASGQQLKNKILTLTKRIPQPGEIAATFAYPSTTVRDLAEVQELHFMTTWHFGHVEDYLPQGRDRVMLPNRCYQTSIIIPGGASGGPTADKYGRVFGINSTGYEGADLSFVSAIQELGPCRLHSVELADGSRHDALTIADLIKLGHVVVAP